MWYRLFIFVLLFGYIFGPRLKGFDVLLFTSISFAFFGMFIILRQKKVNKKLIIFLFLSSVALFYSLIIVTLYGFHDTTIIELNIKNYLYLFAGYFIVYIYFSQYKNDMDLKINAHIFIIGVLNAIFVLLVFASDSLREQMLEILNYKRGARRVAGERSFDMTMGGSALGSIVFSIIFIQGLFLKNYIKRVWLNIGLIIILIATVLLARTGLLIIISSLVVYLLYKTYKFLANKSWIISKKAIKSSTATIVLISLIVIFVIKFIPENLETKLETKVIPWAFEFFYSYVEEGSLSTHSTNIIYNKMYFLPDRPIDTIFGTSNMGRNDVLEYISSDVGFVRIIFAVGIIGLVLSFVPHVYLFCVGLKNWSTSLSSKMLLITIFILFVTNFKELVFLPRGGASILFTFFISTLLIKNKSINSSSGPG